MARERLYLYDTTLRDGQQTPGVDFSLEDKIAIARMLDAFGIDYVEGGYPGANPTDDAFFSAARTRRSRFVAFGMTKRVGVSLSNDPGIAALVAAAGDTVCFVAKSWDYHVHLALGCSEAENLEAFAASVEAARAAGKEAIVDCEHFFDGYKANPAYALDCARAAHQAGARWVVLCDTNGGTLPAQIGAIVQDVISAGIPGTNLGIHAHDDTGQAVANTLAAVEAGVRQIQGTLNGIGERCGNANLVSIIPTLVTKPAFAERFDAGISPQALTGISRLSRAFDELLNRAPNAQAPYVGSSAFATKAGIHASALVKEPQTYEHIPPETVGNSRRLMVSDQGGRSNFIAELKRRGIVVDKSDRRLDTLIALVKKREAEGYAYEGADASFDLLAQSVTGIDVDARTIAHAGQRYGDAANLRFQQASVTAIDAADASFDLLARRTLGAVPDFFKVEGFRCMIERRFDANGQLRTVSEAVVKLRIDTELKMSVAEGKGPVNALDLALRKDLGKFQDEISDLELVDYKVRILNGGTEAVTRVLIESLDASGERWWTVGVSDNIIDASFQALMDSVVYKLMKNREQSKRAAAE